MNSSVIRQHLSARKGSGGSFRKKFGADRIRVYSLAIALIRSQAVLSAGILNEGKICLKKGKTHGKRKQMRPQPLQLCGRWRNGILQRAMQERGGSRIDRAQMRLRPSGLPRIKQGSLHDQRPCRSSAGPSVRLPRAYSAVIPSSNVLTRIHVVVL